MLKRDTISVAQSLQSKMRTVNQVVMEEMCKFNDKRAELHSTKQVNTELRDLR